MNKVTQSLIFIAGGFGVLLLFVSTLYAISDTGSIFGGLIMAIIGILMCIPVIMLAIKNPGASGSNQVPAVIESLQIVEPSEDSILLRAPKAYRCCPNCGHVGIIPKSGKGSCLVLIFLLCLGLLPGLIYGIWAVTLDDFYCPLCGYRSTVPLNTPRGREIFSKLSEDAKNQIKGRLSVIY